MAETRIRTRHVCISGFLQSIAKPVGFERLWLKLRRHEKPTSRVSYLPWNANWSSVAEHFMRTGPADDFTTLTVRVYAYSWGVGNGFMKLARELRKRGMSIEKAVLCDGVYHSGWLPWRAVFSPFWTPRIVVPDNVGEVWWLRQKENKPMGHDILAASCVSTTIHDPRVLSVAHSYMDDAPEFHRLCLQVARS